MRSKSVPCLLAVAALLAFVPAMQAQRAGWSTAIAQPVPVIQSPVQPIVSAPVQPFLNIGAQHPVNGFGFGVTPPITPPIITTSYSSIFSQFPPDHQPRAVAVPQPQVIYVYPNPVPGFGCAYGYSCGGYGYNGGTIVVPNGTVITNSTVIVQQPEGQHSRGGPGAARTQAPHFVPPTVGTTREQVIQQYGTPVTTVYTQSGETLHFSGGATVFMKNGKVATPQQPN
jgi:hypothetical protein